MPASSSGALEPCPSDLPRPVPRLTRRRLLSSAAGAAVIAGAASAAPQTVAAAAKASSRPVLTQSGLYAWPGDYLAKRSQISTLGSKVLRLAHDNMSDAAWAAVQADGLDAHITISGNDRSGFASEHAWINDYLARVDSILSRWPFPWVEVWNEPNFGMWSGATAAQKQAAYGNLLVATNAHIKNAFPGTKVIGFAAGGSSAAAPGFIKGVIQAVPAAAKAFDVCSLHPYITPTAPDQVRKEAWGSWTIAGQVKAIRSLGIQTPMWFTEIGWPVSQGDGGRFATSPSKTVSLAEQAAYTLRLSLMCMTLGVARVNHMYVVDTDNFNGGFFTATGARPVALAMAAQHEILQRPTSMQMRSDGLGGLYHYVVKTARGPVDVAWTAPGADIAMPGQRQSLALDIYGARADARRGRRGAISLGTTPVYLLQNKTV